MSIATTQTDSDARTPPPFRRRLLEASKMYALSIFCSMLLAWIGMLLWQPNGSFSNESTTPQTVGFCPLDLWNNMGSLAKGVIIILFIMSIWSLAVIIDRWLYFSAARKQSRDFASGVANALKQGKLDEAIKVAQRNKKSHLAEVVTAGLQEFRNYGSGGTVTEDQIESSKRALERSEAIVHAKLKRGLGTLATIGSTAPIIGLFGSVVGVINAFRESGTHKAGEAAFAHGVSEALVTTAFGLLIALPVVMTLTYFVDKVEAFDIEMDKSSDELVDYFKHPRSYSASKG
jgi:biopolymer transport protein ExbB/TolQ